MDLSVKGVVNSLNIRLPWQSAPADAAQPAAPLTSDAVEGAPLTGPDYQKLSAVAKRDRLWRAVSAAPYSPLTPPRGAGITAKGFAETFKILLDTAELSKTFDLEADVRPDHEKVFHPFGTVAKVRFEPDPSSPYTGVFRSGAAGIARLSLGADDKQYISGIAVKLFVDGKPSVNLHAIPGLDAQASRDFFANNPSSSIPDPNDFKFKVANVLLKRVANPTRRSVDALAKTDTRGNTIASPSSPAGVTFVPAASVHFAADTTQDFRAELGQLRSGQVVYEVYSTDTPRQRLGALRLESPFVASAFGDRQLSFQHQR